MAQFEIEGFDSLMKELETLDIERIAPMMLKEAGPILEEAVKAKIRPHQETGDMYRSIKSTGASRSKDGYYLCVRPTGKSTGRTHKIKGKRKVPVRNMDKLAWLEFGTSREPARPVLTSAVREAESAVISKMQEVFDREAGV